MTDRTADLALIVEAAREGADLALAERARGLEIERKPGGSPVTNADYRVDAFLKERLLAARPDHGWLSEETPDSPERLKRRRIFVVDPIDGTQAFIANRPWWCIPIAVIEDGQPVAAVIHVPERNEAMLTALGFEAQTWQWEVTRCSSGDRQRLGLLRCLLNQPECLLLDEPTGNLDPENTERVEAVVKEYVTQHTTPVVWVSHSMEQIKRIASRHFRLREGKLVEQ